MTEQTEITPEAKPTLTSAMRATLKSNLSSYAFLSINGLYPLSIGWY